MYGRLEENDVNKRAEFGALSQVLFLGEVS